MPMGGPIHKAALETLDGFRKNGLYGGMQHGHMLGTSFFANTELTYKIHGYKGSDHDHEVRNGLWVTVMQKLRGCKLATCKTPPRYTTPRNWVKSLRLSGGPRSMCNI